jgi:hypothetical protein
MSAVPWYRRAWRLPVHELIAVGPLEIRVRLPDIEPHLLALASRPRADAAS